MSMLLWGNIDDIREREGFAKMLARAGKGKGTEGDDVGDFEGFFFRGRGKARKGGRYTYSPKPSYLKPSYLKTLISPKPI